MKVPPHLLHVKRAEIMEIMVQTSSNAGNVHFLKKNLYDLRVLNERGQQPMMVENDVENVLSLFRN